MKALWDEHGAAKRACAAIAVKTNEEQQALQAIVQKTKEEQQVPEHIELQKAWPCRTWNTRKI